MPPRSPAQQAPPSSTKKQPTKQRAVVPAEASPLNGCKVCARAHACSARTSLPAEPPGSQRTEGAACPCLQLQEKAWRVKLPNVASPPEGRPPTRAAALNAKKKLELGAADEDSSDDEEMVGGREPWACLLIRGARSLELVGAHSPASRHRS